MFTRPIATGGAWTPPIEQSLIFDGVAYLSRTPGSAGNRKTWSWMGWVRRASFGDQALFSARLSASDSDLTNVFFNSSGKLVFAGSATNWRVSTAVYRDVGWYHIAVVLDTTQATANDRIKIYVNGVQVTAFDTLNNPSLNADLGINSTGAHRIGVLRDNGDTSFLAYHNGAMADIHFLDGTALTEAQINSTFLDGVTFDGQTLPAPKAITGLTYGANGFHLAFADSSAFGDDTSGNGNDWTPTGFVAGDQTADVPGRPLNRWNPINLLNNLVSEGGKRNTISGATTYQATFSTLSITSGKYYGECRLVTLGGELGFQVGQRNDAGIGGFTATYGYTMTGSGGYATGEVTASGTATGTVYTTPTANDVFMWAVDYDAQKIWMGLNGSWFNSGDPAAGTGEVLSAVPVTGPWTLCHNRLGTAGVVDIIDPEDFNYTPPTGFLPLSANNLPTPTADGRNYFAVNTRTGTGATYSVTNGPGNGTDFLWGKSRSAATDHYWYDILRGVQQQLESNTTTAETTETTGLTAFNSTGYTAGALAQMNTSAATYVDWMWKLGGAPVSNTDGTITTQVSVAAPGHMSAAIYTGTGTTGTIGHGLGGQCEMAISFARSSAGSNHVTFHKDLTSGGIGYFVSLNTTAAQAASAQFTSINATTLGVGGGANANLSGVSHVMYFFRSIPGLCKVGSVVMNASTDGAYVGCGFLPRRILMKRIDSTSDWLMYDTLRGTINPVDEKLSANTAAVEDTTGEEIDILSSGFKMRATFFAGTWIYVADAHYAGGGDLPWPLAR